MKKRFVLSILIIAVSILCACSVFAQIPESARGPDEGPWPVFAITYGKGMILTSPDGEIWTIRSAGTDVPLTAMAYGKDTFVAVGGRGTIVQGTRDGSTWTLRQSGVQSDLWAVKFSRSHKLFVAVGSMGTVITSPDGTTWTKRANLTAYALRNIALGKDHFVTIGELGAIFTSPDGITWGRTQTQQTDHLVGLTYERRTFVAVGANGRIMTSSDDGATWSERFSGTMEYLSAVTYGNKQFVATGAFGTIVTSPDGRIWTTVNSGSQSWLGAIIHARKQFIVVATDGTVLTSPDGTNWSFSRYGPIIIDPQKVEEKVIMTYAPMVKETVVVMAAEPTAEEKVVAAAAGPKVIILAFEDIHFDFDKAILKPEAQRMLKTNIQMLKDNPKVRVRIAGYTSAAGTEAYNQELSERRAMAVREYLVNEGVIERNRLSTIGYGRTNPATYEAAPKEIYSTAAKANMRVLFEIIVQ